MAKKTPQPPSGTRGDRTVLDNRFSLTLPDGWQDRCMYRFEGPIEDGILHAINVNIAHDIDMPDVETYAQLQIRSLEATLQGYTQLKQGPLVLDCDVSAWEVVYKWIPVKDRKVYQRAVWVLHNRTAYMLTATFSKKTWKMMAGVVDDIIKSFDIPAA